MKSARKQVSKYLFFLHKILDIGTQSATIAAGMDSLRSGVRTEEGIV